MLIRGCSSASGVDPATTFAEQAFASSLLFLALHPRREGPHDRVQLVAAQFVGTLTGASVATSSRMSGYLILG